MDVRLPDGRILKNVPEGTTKAQIEAKLGMKFAAPVADAPAPQRSFGQELVRQGGLAARHLAEGVAGTVGIVADPIGASIGAATGQPYQPLAGYVSDRLTDAGLPEPETATERVVGDASRAVASGGAFLKGAQLAQAAPGVAGQAATVLSQQPKAQLASAAAGGAASGVAEEAGAGPVGQAAAGLAASFAPAAASGVARGVVRGGETGRQAVERSVDEFAAAGTTPSVGQATGRKSLQHLETILGSVPGGAGVMSRVAETTRDQMGARVKQIADNLTRGASSEKAGRAIEAGIQGPGGFMNLFRAKSKFLYDQLDRHIPPSTQVGVANTLGTLQRLTAPIQGATAVSGGSLLKNGVLDDTTQRLLADATNGTLPYEALKALRTRIGERLTNSGLLDDVPKAQLKQVYGALSDDMAAAAHQAGPAAGKAYERANSYYRAGANRIDGSLRPITARLQKAGTSPEEIYKTAISGADEGGTRLWALRRTIGPGYWKPVAATVLRRMGRAVNSQQDDLGEQFSTETFLTNWNKLSPQAKTALFESPALAKDMDKIAAAASKIREGSKALANPSGTAARVSNIAGGYLVLSSLMSGGAAGVAQPALALAGTHHAAKLMTSPPFVRWLAKATELNPAYLAPHIAKLSSQISDDSERNEALQAYASDLAAEISGVGNQQGEDADSNDVAGGGGQDAGKH